MPFHVFLVLALGAFSTDFPRGFSRGNCSLSQLTDSFFIIQTSLKRQKPLTCRCSFKILYLENNLKSKEPDGLPSATTSLAGRMAK
jgi:hypothetical protein